MLETNNVPATTPKGNNSIENLKGNLKVAFFTDPEQIRTNFPYPNEKALISSQ